MTHKLWVVACDSLAANRACHSNGQRTAKEQPTNSQRTAKELPENGQRTQTRPQKSQRGEGTKEWKEAKKEGERAAKNLERTNECDDLHDDEIICKITLRIVFSSASILFYCCILLLVSHSLCRFTSVCLSDWLNNCLFVCMTRQHTNNRISYLLHYIYTLASQWKWWKCIL